MVFLWVSFHVLTCSLCCQTRPELPLFRFPSHSALSLSISTSSCFQSFIGLEASFQAVKLYLSSIVLHDPSHIQRTKPFLSLIVTM
nr:MAG TPA: hypothetical protein [Caudoviricetes sp.]